MPVLQLLFSSPPNSRARGPPSPSIPMNRESGEKHSYLCRPGRRGTAGLGSGGRDEDDDGGAPAAAFCCCRCLCCRRRRQQQRVWCCSRRSGSDFRLLLPLPDDDVAATMAAQGLAATGADGCSSGISRKKESRGRKEGQSTWFFRSQVQTEERRKAFPLCAVSPFSASVSLKALCFCRKPVSF